jgi:hypothetical protein
MGCVLIGIGIGSMLIGLQSSISENRLRKNIRSLITSGLVNVYPFGLASDVNLSRLINVYPMGGHEILKKANKNIKMLGITVNLFVSQRNYMYMQLQRMVERGCKLQILMLNPHSPHVAYRERDENNMHLKEQIELAINIKKLFIYDIKKEYRSNVKIKLYDAYPLYSMLIIDDNLIRVTPYLYNKKGLESPTLEYINKKGGLFEVYSKHFDDLWNAETTVDLFKVHENGILESFLNERDKPPPMLETTFIQSKSELYYITKLIARGAASGRTPPFGLENEFSMLKYVKVHPESIKLIDNDVTFDVEILDDNNNKLTIYTRAHLAERAEKTVEEILKEALKYVKDEKSLEEEKESKSEGLVEVSPRILVRFSPDPKSIKRPLNKW